MLKLAVVYWKQTDILFYFERGPDFPPIFFKYDLEHRSADCELTIKWPPREYSLQSAVNFIVIKKVRYLCILVSSMCENSQSQLYICIKVPSVVTSDEQVCLVLE